MKSPHPIIKNAFVAQRVSGEYIIGNVFQDRRYPPGKQIYTSDIIWRSEDFVETKNTTYRIESWAPDAKK